MNVQRISYSNNVYVRPLNQARPTFAGRSELAALEKSLPEIRELVEKIRPVVEKYEPKNKEVLKFNYGGKWDGTGFQFGENELHHILEAFSKKHLTPISQIMQGWAEKLGLAKPTEYIQNIQTAYNKLSSYGYSAEDPGSTKYVNLHDTVDFINGPLKTGMKIEGQDDYLKTFKPMWEKIDSESGGDVWHVFLGDYGRYFPKNVEEKFTGIDHTTLRPYCWIEGILLRSWDNLPKTAGDSREWSLKSIIRNMEQIKPETIEQPYLDKIAKENEAVLELHKKLKPSEDDVQRAVESLQAAYKKADDASMKRLQYEFKYYPESKPDAATEAKFDEILPVQRKLLAELDVKLKHDSKQPRETKSARLIEDTVYDLEKSGWIEDDWIGGI